MSFALLELLESRLLLTDGLVGYWALDESLGTVASDTSGANLNGSVNSGATWANGIIDGGIQYNGSTGRVLIGNAPQLNPSSAITLAAWIRPERIATQYLIKKATSSVNGYELALASSGTAFVRFNQASSGNTFRIDSPGGIASDGATWTQLAATYDGAVIRLYVNGVLAATKNATFSIASNTLSLSLGGEGSSTSSALKGGMDDVHVLSRAMSSEEIAELYASADISQQEPFAGHWAFDEGAGAVANDASPQQMNGTLNSGTSWTSGTVDGALAFNGSDGRVTVPNAPPVNSRTHLTIAAWVRPQSAATQYAIKKASSTIDGYELAISSSGHAFVRFHQASSGNTYRVDSATPLLINGALWTHLAATYDGSEIRLYVNGELSAINQASFALKGNTLDLTFGGQGSGTASSFAGGMDDVHLLNRAMSAAEVAELASRQTAPFAGHWSMNEGSGTRVGDSSGENLHGDLSGGVAWASGILGSGLWFNGSDGRVLIADAPPLDPSTAITIAAWLKPEKSGTQYVLKKAAGSSVDGYELALSSNGSAFVRFNRATSGDTFRVDSATPYPIDGMTWVHVAATYDGLAIRLYINGVLSASKEAGVVLQGNNLALSLGGEATNTSSAFAGMLDDVRILNRAMSAGEIADLAAEGAGGMILPFHGRWALAEGAGGLAGDGSGFDLHGSLSGGAAWASNPDQGGVWFNGGDGRLTIPNAPQLNPLSAITIAAWIKPEELGTQYPIKKALHGSVDGYELSLSANGWFFVRFNQATAGDAYRVDSTASYPVDGVAWAHVAATYDGAEIRLYVNGELNSSLPASFFIKGNTLPLSLGGHSVIDDRAFKGALDDVHILNRALSASEVADLFAFGSGPRLRPLEELPITQHTGEKPQSKLWQYAENWWGIFAGSLGASVWRLDDTTWTHVLNLSSSTVVQADTRTVGDVTHILLYAGDGATSLASLQYVDGRTPTYTLWSERPSLIDVPLSSGVETATIDVDSLGRMWVAWEGMNAIQVRHSDWPYLSWSAATILAQGVDEDDIAAVTALPGQIAVMWSDQNTQRFGFRVRSDGDDLSLWSQNEVPGAQSALDIGDGMADDHINLAVGSDGTVYAAVKTSYDTPGAPKIGLLVRRPTGVWDPFYTVDLEGTRPIVLLDELADRLMVVYTASEQPSEIVYRVSGLSEISVRARERLITGAYNNVSSTRDMLSGEFVVVASNATVLTGVRFDGGKGLFGGGGGGSAGLFRAGASNGEDDESEADNLTDQGFSGLLV